MGLYCSGKGESGDLPPRPQCAPPRHARLPAEPPKLKLRLLVGKSAPVY
jgi:hypothetical protein